MCLVMRKKYQHFFADAQCGRLSFHSLRLKYLQLEASMLQYYMDNICTCLEAEMAMYHLRTFGDTTLVSDSKVCTRSVHLKKPFRNQKKDYF